jgi:hypothetical protein
VRRVVKFTDQDAFVTSVRQVLRDVIDRMNDPDVELVRPVTFGIRRWRMPVVLFLIVDKDWQFTRRMNQIAERHRCQRDPSDEMRIRPERIWLIIHERHVWCAGKDDRVTCPGFLQCVVMPRLHGLHVRRVKLAAFLVVHAHGPAS